jgi:hypothetical protein
MKVYAKYLLLIALVFGFTAAAVAGETLKDFGTVQGRSYHSDFYEEKSCDYCHTNTPPTTFPADFVCLDCHDLENLVKVSARPEEDKWQNPHNNLHYGKDVPCMECHGEHQTREPLCNKCHTFNYPEHKN